MRGYIRKILIILMLILCLCSKVQADLSSIINDIINPHIQKKVTFSIHIIKADSGATVYDYHAKDALIPASNMKIITSAAALKYLGPDYEYITKVGLYGDTLVIIGSGDPLLGDEKTDEKYGRKQGWIFETIIRALQENQIEEINDIVIDSSIFDNQRVHPNWPPDDLNKWYACEISGLNYNCNCIALSTERFDNRVAITIEPQTSYVEMVNKIQPITSGSSAVGTYRNNKPNNITVYGKCQNRVGPFDVAIERPAAFFGFLLAENLATSGIKVKGRLIEKMLKDKSNFELLCEFKTSFSDCLSRCNKNSLGLAAESLLKTIAAENSGGKDGSWKRAQELIGEFLTELGIDNQQYIIDDGSGLSRENRLSAYAITTVLSYIYKSDNWQIYQDSLAVAAEDGTIGKYFKGDKYRGQIIGKTGYINGVKSFSGICSTEQGDYIFSIIANGANMISRYKINDIAKAIIDNAQTGN